MKKILKRLATGFLAFATIVTALPTTAVHASEKQYWTESAERVGIVEKVMNDGSIGSTFNEGHMTVEGEDAFCVHSTTNTEMSALLWIWNSRDVSENGEIVTIASNGSFTTSPGMRAYCSSKHAVAGLAKSVALEFGPHGIHCNYICPGGVDTPMIGRIEKNTFGDTKTHKEAEQVFGAQYLDKRYCRPDEVANLALYLASDVSSHIMGFGIRLDGGMDALC